MTIEREIEMRYKGQHHSIKIRSSEIENPHDLRARFDQEYMRRYGHTNSADVEIVVLHSLATLHTRQPEIARLARAGEDGGKPHLLGARPIFFLEESRFLDTEIHDRSLLAAGFAGRGPAVIVEYGSSTLVGPRDQYRIGDLGEIYIDCHS